MSVGAGDVVRADVRGTWNATSAVQNTFHLQNTATAVDEADAIDDLVSILEALYVLLSNYLNILYVIDDIRAINETQSTDVGVGLFVDPTPGTQSSSAVLQNAWGLSLDTARLNVRGRKFFGPATPNGYAQSGVLVANAILAMADVGDYMIAPRPATNSTWRFGVIASSDGAFLPFTNYGISPTVVTQRRRRLGVGE